MSRRFHIRFKRLRALDDLEKVRINRSPFSQFNGTSAGFAIDCRSDLSELQAKNLDIFDKFNNLRIEIDSPLTSHRPRRLAPHWRQNFINSRKSTDIANECRPFKRLTRHWLVSGNFLASKDSSSHHSQQRSPPWQQKVQSWSSIPRNSEVTQ